MADDTEWKALPTEEKCVHKLWKARVAGYKEACQKFGTLDAKSPEFSKYLGIVKKFTMDSNAVAQENGLDAVLLFVENAQQAGRTAGEVVSGIVLKCLNSARPKTKEKAMEIILMFVEIDKQEPVMEELLKGLENKQPKVVAACVRLINLALESFGSKVISLKPVMKCLSKLLEDRDKTVRDETKLLVVEMYRWIPSVVRTQLPNLKPVQIQELEAEFEKLPPGKPTQIRFMRSQQDLKEKADVAGTAGDSGAVGGPDEEEAEPEADPYDFMTAVDILPKLPKNFFEQIEAKKWQERKEVLEVCLKLCENPKISPGEHGDLVHALKKVVAKDTNVMLVSIAAKSLHGLAVGLRKKFQPYASLCIKMYLEKFKEKKVSVVTALRDAIDSATQTMVNLESLNEDICVGLVSKNPSIKTETALYLARTFTRAKPATLPKKQLKVYCVPLCKTINDTVPEVREASFQALGTAMKVVGEKVMMPFLAEIEALKLAKVKESCDKAELVYMTGHAVSKPKAQEPKPVERPKTAVSAPKMTVNKRPTTAPAKSGGAKVAVGGTKGKKKVGGATGPAAVPQEAALSEEEAEEKTSALLGAETVGDLSNTNFKLRLAAMESMKQAIDRTPQDDVPIQALVRSIAKKPGLKETNFQVLKLRLSAITQLASFSKFTRTSADVVISPIVDKIGDNKNGSDAKEALSSISEALGLPYVSDMVVPLGFEQKNPKNTSETLFWLARSIEEFGLKVSVKMVVVYLKKALAATNPTVRSAGIKLVGVLYMYVGPATRALFEDEKPALLQLIDAEIEKVKSMKPSPPTRGLRSSGGDTQQGGGDDSDGGDEDKEEVNDLMPRTDISEKITDSLLEKMEDKNWKIRKEGLEEVQAIFSENKFVLGNLGGLPEALKKRLGDSNQLLIKATLSICQTVAKASGPHTKKHIGPLGGAIVKAMGDGKPMLRAAAVEALDAWVAETKLTPFVTENIFAESLAVENPNLRSTLLGWLSKVLPENKKLSTAELKECLLSLLTCLSDRNADVRKSSQEALVPFMIHTGYDSMVRAAGKLAPGTKEQVFTMLEKARGNLPAKQAKAPVASAVTSEPSPAVDLSDVLPKKGSASTKDKEGGSGGPTKTAPKGKTAKAAPPKSAPSRKKGEESDGTPLMNTSVPKQQRLKDEKTLKVLKWNFPAPRPEIVEQLRDHMEKNFSKPFMENLFHTDFQKHIKAIQQLDSCLASFRDITIENLDMILKWFTLRFYDTNPSMLNKALEYLHSLFTILHEEGYQLPEWEASSFIPYLILKVGDSKENVRNGVRKIFKLICNVYPASKMFFFVMGGLESKNSKQRTECLEELGYLISTFGTTVMRPSPGQALKEIAKQISYRDNNVRSAALNTVVVAHGLMGDSIFKVIGRLNDKERGYLDERIKRTATKPKSAAPEPVPAAVAASGAATTTPPKRSAAAEQEQDEEEPTKPTTAVSPRPSGPSKPNFKHIKMDWPEVSNSLSDPSSRPPPSISADLDLPGIPAPDRSSLPPKILFQFLHKSSDANVAISSVISQIANHQPARAQAALSQIDDVLKCPQRSALFGDHIDQLFIVFTVQIGMVLSKHLPSAGTPGGIENTEVLDLTRSLIGALMALTEHREVIRKASLDILKNLLQSLFQLTISERIQENPKLVPSLNVVISKLVENAHPTNTICAIVGLLHTWLESYSSPTGDYRKLLLRALFKSIKLLPQMAQSDDLDPGVIMTHALAFFQAFPNEFWAGKGAEGDTPLRTMKTLVFTLVKEYKSEIWERVAAVDGLKGSNLELYIKKCLAQGAGEQSAKKQRRETHDKLTEIFRKIGSKELTKVGLNELFEFKQKHPEADMEPFVKESSHFFQTYIDRGLRMIAQERKANAAANPSSSKEAPPRKSAVSRVSPPSWCTEDIANVVGGKEKLDEILSMYRKHGIPDTIKIDMDHGELCAWAEEVISKHEKKVGVLKERHPHAQPHHSDISVLECNVQGRANALSAQPQREARRPVPSQDFGAAASGNGAPRQQAGDRRSQPISKVDLASLQAKLNKIKSNR